MNGFFITGTDTDVGKTVLSSLLCVALDGCYWKPIQTGAREGTDRRRVLAWSQIRPENTFPEAYVFDEPVSPHLAARHAAKRITLERIIPPVPTGDHPLIVEGAGGVLVPINGEQLMTDLMRYIGLPVILATRTRLGTINHTLLSLQALRRAELVIQGVVMLGEENYENLRAIEHYGQVPVIGRVPKLADINATVLKEVFATRFDLGALKS